ncbi:MAG: hypothetical protein LBU70_09285 [Chitinispirillales bacterium]|nr:hypothetical protein [Chitinispirillales bacterium]
MNKCIIRNFDRSDFNPDTFISDAIEKTRKHCEGRKVFLLVSGGVDSTVVFALLNKALGPSRVLGLHIDTGLMRQNESAAILDFLKSNGFDNLRIENAEEEFLTALDSVYDPEKKRQIIGDKFLAVKDKVSQKLSLNSDEWILAQGTIYPDIIETAAKKEAGESGGKIKTHHNRVDAIMELIEKGQIIEPIAPLYKDEVRAVGVNLGLPRDLLWRHPFPGPGLGVRVLCNDGTTLDNIPEEESAKLETITSTAGYTSTVLPIRSTGKKGGERTYARPVLIKGAFDREKIEKITAEIIESIPSVNRVVYALTMGESSTDKTPCYTAIKAHTTRDRLNKLRAIDAIITEALIKSGEYDTIWQMPVVLLPITDGKNDGEPIVLRPVQSQDAMTADIVWLKQDTINTVIAQKSAIKGIGDIFLDVTPKPPGTIEWE